MKTVAFTKVNYLKNIMTKTLIHLLNKTNLKKTLLI